MKGFQFIGRETELRKLHYLVERAVDNHGGTIVLKAAAGMGTSTLLSAFKERAYKELQSDDIIFLNAEGQKFIGTENAYGPFKEILQNFESPELRRREIVKKILKVVPDLLDILPVLGPAVKAASKVADIALTSENIIQADKGILLIQRYIDRIRKIASNCKLLVIVISEAQWIDTSSCQLLLRLARAAQENRLVIILTYAPEEVDQKSSFNDLLYEMRRKKTAEVVSLIGWNIEEVHTYLNSEFGEMIDPNLAEWLQDLCNGHPSFISEYLSLLRENRIIEYVDSKYTLNGQIKRNISGEWDISGQLKNIMPPDNIGEVLKKRFNGLQEQKKTDSANSCCTG